MCLCLMFVDNIIVCDDGSVHLNDWGSARPPRVITNTGGTNPVYGCPAMGAAFESDMGSFLYTPLSDLRALFISLLAFSLLPRQRGEERLAAVLPWERVPSACRPPNSCICTGRFDVISYSHKPCRCSDRCTSNSSVYVKWISPSSAVCSKVSEGHCHAHIAG